MKTNTNVILHFTMAITALLVLVLPPVIDGTNPSLKFMPIIKTMDGTYKEQNEKVATISHALQGNAIFFLGASEVSTSVSYPHAVFNYFNKSLNIPVVAYGDSWVDSVIQLSLLTAHKEDFSEKTKVVLLVSPDSFFIKKIPPSIFEKHVTGMVFDKVESDPVVSSVLDGYLKNIDINKVDHLPFNQTKEGTWSMKAIVKEVKYQIGNFSDLVSAYYLGFLKDELPGNKDGWRKLGDKPSPAWGGELSKALLFNKKHRINAENHWMEPSYYQKKNRAIEWGGEPLLNVQIQSFDKMIKLLKERKVQIIVIVDPLNPWALKYTDRFKATDSVIAKTLRKYNVPYLDMYDQPYQNGWNRDYIHPTDLAWVAMDKFIYENFK